jgi:hypothetical protein
VSAIFERNQIIALPFVSTRESHVYKLIYFSVFAIHFAQNFEGKGVDLDENKVFKSEFSGDIANIHKPFFRWRISLIVRYT